MHDLDARVRSALNAAAADLVVDDSAEMFVRPAAKRRRRRRYLVGAAALALLVPAALAVWAVSGGPNTKPAPSSHGGAERYATCGRGGPVLVCLTGTKRTAFQIHANGMAPNSILVWSFDGPGSHRNRISVDARGFVSSRVIDAPSRSTKVVVAAQSPDHRNLTLTLVWPSKANVGEVSGATSTTVVPR
jgi:hypothetical protein